MSTVRIGNRLVGPDQPCFIIGEIGINHNGSLDLTRKLIDMAKNAGCDAVKFQKRTVDVVYTAEELAKPRETPFGSTNGDLKRALEFGKKEYDEIDKYCNKVDIPWFASPWDEASVDFLEQYDPPCYKIASACLTDDGLISYVRSKGRPIILSTGMSNMNMINHAVDILGKNDLVILHCTSVYPKVTSDGLENLSMVNLEVIKEFRKLFNPVPIGYSSHLSGIMPVYAAAAKGACMVESHITLERALWGSDQASSLEPQQLINLCRMIRELKVAEGDGVKRIYPAEIEVMKKLRRKG
ncbi:MAG: N-acetylneuraminate synthase family protein [Candidatus Yanofskybacteria bacterium]|nr:N-acetylneuraminate synthase family protein [Candidatus Yanofskybacteria bacterium]